MKRVDVVRAWKDREYRATLTAEELATVPERPIDEYDIDRALLESVTGGMPSSGWVCSISGECGGGSCNPFPW